VLEHLLGQIEQLLAARGHGVARQLSW
jgi:hypothetical protein